MATIESLSKAYIEFVLAHGHRPESVFKFTQTQEISEAEFYNFFGTFEGLEQYIWAEYARLTIAEVTVQEVWLQYTAREKALSFFYGFFELLKSNRSFAVYTYRQAPRGLGTPRILEKMKDVFESFAEGILNEGLQSQELSDRKFLSKRYKDALWLQLGFVLNFWLNDSSAGFEKTDEAIEKGVNLTFDLFQRTPLDNLFDYGKFLFKNGVRASP